MKKIAIAILVSWLGLCSAVLAQTASVQHLSSSSLGVSLQVEINPQHVLSAFGCSAIAGGTAGNCIAYNSATVPGAGSLTGSLVIDSCPITSAAGCTLSRIPFGAEYSAGIVILLSSATSPFTYTTGTETGFLWADYN